MKGIIEAMYLDINRTTRISCEERIEGGMVISRTPISFDEHIKARELYDWSVEKQLRELNWKDLRGKRGE